MKVIPMSEDELKAYRESVGLSKDEAQPEKKKAPAETKKREPEEDK